MLINFVIFTYYVNRAQFSHWKRRKFHICKKKKAVSRRLRRRRALLHLNTVGAGCHPGPEDTVRTIVRSAPPKATPPAVIARSAVIRRDAAAAKGFPAGEAGAGVYGRPRLMRGRGAGLNVVSATKFVFALAGSSREGLPRGGSWRGRIRSPATDEGSRSGTECSFSN